MTNIVAHHTPEQDRRNKIILTICLIIAVTLSIAVVVGRWNNGVDAQNHAVRVMFSVVNDYMNANEGAWPKSWQDLESFPSEGNWYDPVDYELTKKHVVIDFEPNLAEVSEQSPPEFQAIRPVNPVFDFGKDPRLVQLLITVKRYHGETSE
ncbi:hypothetical protein [Rubinisphaera sp.]|uniref:hypothetical protein n=1 Tax=Rubinisphaera sp. TaxID=2024857 RepID=UPI000C0F5153|nr:hypothetical protein [Rubinisphaera sp.]MBV11073.1 hypothetical protein [Rubinisphaera sp.]|tara:strand:- start:29862 stop:30314 length:453 start_codon:yes stop_codon:yes gene_type:complete